MVLQQAIVSLRLSNVTCRRRRLKKGMVETLRNTKTSNGETQGWSPAPVGLKGYRKIYNANKRYLY